MKIKLSALIDSGATKAYIKRECLPFISHKIKKANINVTGRYKFVGITEVAVFKIRLPKFSRQRYIEVEAAVEDSAVGRHDIVLRTSVLSKMGMILDFHSKTMSWLGITRPMRPSRSIANANVADSSPESTLPTFAQKAIARVDHKQIQANEYDKYNFQDMVSKCTHLLVDQKNKLLSLFQRFANLFSGKLGCVANEEVSVQLKHGARPYHAAAYSIPVSVYDLCRKEVDDLVEARVLRPIRNSEWAAPCLFRRKKDGRVRFITDFRRLNASLTRSPYHLPLIDDVLHRVAGFTHATCLDLNRGYYHFMLDKPSQRICSIILPWGKYSYL